MASTEQVVFLLKYIDSINGQVDYKKLGELTGLKPNAARMRYSRLRKSHASSLENHAPPTRVLRSRTITHKESTDPIVTRKRNTPEKDNTTEVPPRPTKRQNTISGPDHSSSSSAANQLQMEFQHEISAGNLPPLPASTAGSSPSGLSFAGEQELYMACAQVAMHGSDSGADARSLETLFPWDSVSTVRGREEEVAPMPPISLLERVRAFFW